MPPVETAARETMLVQVDHDVCQGTGRVKRETRVVKKSQRDYHFKNHVYHPIRQGETVGEKCNCDWITEKKEASCVGCGGHGYQHRTLTVPLPGDKVEIRDRALLEEVLGEDAPTKPGVVYEVQKPDEHNLEIQFGLAVQVTWDRLKADGSIPKKGATLWAFGISEIRIVR